MYQDKNGGIDDQKPRTNGWKCVPTSPPFETMGTMVGNV